MKYLILSALLMASNQLLACSCMKLSLQDHYQVSDAVFMGKAVLTKSQNGQHNVTEFEVQTVYKGDLGVLAHIKSAKDSAACGLQFSDGQTYLVFSNANGMTGICSGTRSYPGEAWGDTQQEVDAFLQTVHAE